MNNNVIQGFRLSPQQERLWLLQQDNHNLAYRAQGAVLIEGNLNTKVLETALQNLVNRHEILRTTFHHLPEMTFPVQVIADSSPQSVQNYDLKALSPQEQEAKIQVLIAEMRQMRFNHQLQQNSLLHTSLVTLSSHKHVLLINLPAICMDSTGLKNLVLEISRLYAAALHSQEVVDEPIQYVDLAEWQNELLASEDAENGKVFWRQKKMTSLVDFRLPFESQASGKSVFDPTWLTSTIDSNLVKSITTISQKYHTSVSTFFMTCWQILLWRFVEQQDIVVGIAHNGRDYEQTEETLGLLSKYLPLHYHPKEGLSFSEVLKQTHEAIQEAVRWQEYFIWEQFDLPDRDDAQLSFFPFCFDSEDRLTEYPTANLRFSIYWQNSCIDRFKIKLTCIHNPDSITAEFHYDSSLFLEEDINRLARYFQHLLTSVVKNPHAAISGLDLLNDVERQDLLSMFNQMRDSDPSTKCIDQWFEEQVACTPDNIAITFEGQHLSYAELNTRANQLAHYLKKKGGGPDSIVAVMEDRTPEMIITLLGILKAGGAYLPIDIQSPADRILYTLRDSKTKILLARDCFVKHIPFTQLQNLQNISQDIVVTAPRPPIRNLDALPFPDRSLVDYSKYDQYIGEGCVKKNISLIATRGCPYKCLYCHTLWPKKHVIRSAQNIFEEILLHYDQGYTTFCLLDDIFNLNQRNSEAFFQLVIKNNLKIRLLFPSGLRGDILTPDYIDLMVEAGVIQMALALETASPRLQRLIHKNLDLEKLEEILVYLCQKHPYIILDLFTMLGFPTETEKEALMTIDFIKRLKWLHFPLLYTLKIYPNTPMAHLAMEHGITKEAIESSSQKAYHELPDTLPFSKSFLRKCQASFMQEYFLSPERLARVIPAQKKVLTREELIARYEAYLPGDLESYPEVVRLLSHGDFYLGDVEFDKTNSVTLSPSTSTTKKFTSSVLATDDRLRVLLLDLSQHFSHEPDQLSNMVEAPLGLMYLLTYLNQKFGDRIQGKILKSMVDFDNFEELECLINDFNPQVIGIRTLSLYKEFFHKTVSLIKQWCSNVPIVTGGPYATSEYTTLLSDPNVNVVVLGEGELTFSELIEKILENDKKLPNDDVLEQIAGLAFIPRTAARECTTHRKILLLDKVANVIAREEINNPNRKHQAMNSAYIIYTSGSTGKPKGVTVTHANVVRLFEVTHKWYNFNEYDVWTLFHSYAFDFSVWELWGALFYGGRLVVVPYLVSRSPEEFYDLLWQEQVTVLNQTPSAFRQLIWIEGAKDIGANLALRLVIFGGEALDLQSLKPWFERHGDQHPQLVNMYGITETTVHVTYRPLSIKDLEKTSGSRIGRPIPDLQLYILDQRLQPVPIGLRGELYVGGAGLTPGYLYRSTLTAARFIPHPFSTEPGQRLYKTGDLARYWPDGDIEFLGRSDHQVKLRGFRIELGEIETVLKQHPAVREGVVLIRAKESVGEEMQLIAYIIPQQDQEPPDSELRYFLKEQLPEYMIPAAFVLMERLPLTSNGKLDRQALPAPDQVRPKLEETFVAPRTHVEKTLSEIWAKVLGLEQIGIYDNFFELGGDSILNVQVVAQAHQAGLQLTVKQIFQYQTIAELAVVTNTTPIVAEQGPVTGSVPLTPIQRMFFEHDIPQPHHWNQAILLEVKQTLKASLLEQAIQQLLWHHDALRLRFVQEGLDWKQTIATPDKTFSVAFVDLSTLKEVEQERSLETKAAEFQTGLNLSQGPLLQVAIFNFGPRKPNHLLIIIHHLVVDGISWRILLEDLLKAYDQISRDSSVQLPPKTTSFKNWAEQLMKYSRSETLQQELGYWLARPQIQSQNLPVDCQNGEYANIEASARTVSMSLNTNETRALLREVPKAYGSQINDVLLTALVQALSQWTGRSAWQIDLEGHGREDILEGVDLSRTVGWFTTLFPVYLELTDDVSTPGDTLISIKEQLRQIPNRGIGYGLLRYLSDNPEISQKLQDFPRSEVSFNYLGQLDQSLPDSSPFTLVQKPIGPVHDPQGKRWYLLEVVGSVLENQLQIDWIYSENLHYHTTIENLVRNYMNILRSLIVHCQSTADRHFTPSDFPLAKLNQQEFDVIIAQITE